MGGRTETQNGGGGNQNQIPGVQWRGVRGAGQAIHSNGSHKGQPEAWVPHAHLRCLSWGDNDGAGEMLPSLTPSPGCTRGQGCRGSKGAGPLPYPPNHSKVWGRGATSSVSEGGSERAGHLPKVMQHSRD